MCLCVYMEEMGAGRFLENIRCQNKENQTIMLQRKSIITESIHIFFNK